jgi:hypothetical protein
MRSGFAMSAFVVSVSLLVTMAHGQGKATLITGALYRVHPGFLEVQSGEKTISVVKVNAATIYWNGRTDKKATAKELRQGDGLIIEAAEKDGVPVAQKVRFAHAGDS